MKNISIFASPPRYFNRTPLFNYPHLQKGSSMIRGEQIAKYLGAKYNPKSGYENDLLIYVKPGRNLKEIRKGAYIDVIDSPGLIMPLRRNPGLNIIVCSTTTRDYFKRKGHKNKIFFIPQHHCNFENIKRTKRKVTRVGVLGSAVSFSYPHDEFRKQMKAMGLQFLTNFSFRNRQEIVDFYKKIDIQVSWSTREENFKNPLRLVNAASFGIPTVTYPQIAFRDFKGNYLSAKTIKTMIKKIEKLKDDQDYYRWWSKKVTKAAEPYHISKIAKLYRKLK
jgi:hypothetical protein